MIFIVEGHGEEEALPLLVRRVLVELLGVSQRVELMRALPKPQDKSGNILRVPRGKLLIEGEFKRHIELAARRAASSFGIIVLVDADDDPAHIVGPRLVSWAQQAAPHREVSVVCACREYESWLLAAAHSLEGTRGFSLRDTVPEQPEAHPRDAKGWLSAQMSAGYRETVDQGPLTRVVALEEVWRRMCSFDKLVRDLARLVGCTAPPRPGAEGG